MSKLSLTRQVLAAVFPINCLGCGDEADWVCPDCQRALRLQSDELCFCGKAATDGLCDKHRQELGLNGLVTLWPYHDKIAQELVAAVKYRGHFDAVNWLARHYQRAVLRRLPRGEFVVTAVPLGRDRLRARGFNQAELVAKALTRPLYDYQNLLERCRETLPQVGLTRRARQKNISRAFKAKAKIDPPSQVILVDDVITTGATLRSAAIALRRRGVEEIWALTIAHG